MSNPPPAPPPGPPPKPLIPPTSIKPPPPTLTVPSTPPEKNSILFSLLTYNGHPFMDHWEFFLSPSAPSLPSPTRGVSLSPAGNVHTGFWLEVSRGRDISAQNPPDRVVPLQWISHDLFGGEWDEALKQGNGELEGNLERKPVLIGGFEGVLSHVEMPGKSLRAVNDDESGRRGDGKRIRQRNCQTWVVECVEELVRRGLVDERVGEYLRETRQ
ncbi:hypothetical protein QBC43DRAFT_310463 [Cladorrhinum sp. PSN259]|nr:hypothetical protein QBC43DRAFT_310463 [Cladorrhinum sp. PSN259]